MKRVKYCAGEVKQLRKKTSIKKPGTECLCPAVNGEVLRFYSPTPYCSSMSLRRFFNSVTRWSTLATRRLSIQFSISGAISLLNSNFESNRQTVRYSRVIAPNCSYDCFLKLACSRRGLNSENTRTALSSPILSSCSIG